jgi:hypothetical protein
MTELFSDLDVLYVSGALVALFSGISGFSGFSGISGGFLLTPFSFLEVLQRPKPSLRSGTG